MTAPSKTLPSVNDSIARLTDQSLNKSIRANALANLIEDRKNDLIGILPAHVDFERMKQLFVLNVKKTPKLLDCDVASLMQAVYTASAMGLEPDPYFGQVYLIPYGKNVQVIPGYRGLMQLARNTGQISSISCESVHENDEYSYQLGSDPRIDHRPALKARGEILAFYCVIKFKDGSQHIEWMNREEVDRIRDASSSRKGPEDPWVKHYEEMGKKTVLRRGLKRCPVSLSREFRNALAVSDSTDIGRPYEVDRETGEVIDVWAEPAQAAAPAPAIPSNLENFAPTASSPAFERVAAEAEAVKAAAKVGTLPLEVTQ